MNIRSRTTTRTHQEIRSRS